MLGSKARELGLNRLIIEVNALRVIFKCGNLFSNKKGNIE